MGGELFMAMAGVNMVHVPYRGLAPALTDLLSGQGNTPDCFPRSADGMEPLVMTASRHSVQGSAWEASGLLSTGGG
jgi:hypothetical protein